MANFFDQFDKAPSPAGRNFFDQFDDQQPDSGDSFESRFQESSTASGALDVAMKDRALEMTRGQPRSGITQLAGEMENIVPAAGQGTNPNIGAHAGNLVSARTTTDEEGNILYQDPSTGQFRQTDSATQVAIRDPADGQVKVFSRSAETNESGLVGVSRSLAPGFAAGAPTARPAIAAATKAVQPKASDVFATAKPYYREFAREASEIDVPAKTASGIAERLRGALDKANLIEELATPVYAAVRILDKGEPITLDALQNVKRVVQRGFKSPDKNVRDAAGVVSKEIVKVINEVSPTAGKAYKTADEIQSAAYALQDIQRKQDIAGLRVGRAGYGGNAVNSMRQVLSPIAQKGIEGKVTGLKPNELQAVRDIVEGTGATNFLRGVGQLSPSKGIFQTVAAIPTLGASAVVGGVANKLATILTGKQIDRLRELIAKRSPEYSKAVEKAVDRFEKAQLDFATNPSPGKFASYVSASRALSAGLTRDGIPIASGDLLRSVQGTMRSAADDEQPESEGIVND